MKKEINLSINNKSLREKIAAYFGFVPVAELNKFKQPTPKYRPEVKDICVALEDLGFYYQGAIRDEFVYIIIYANSTDMYYLHINYDGEYVAILKHINCQHVPTLLKQLEEPNIKIIEAKQNLATAASELGRELKVLTVAGEQENAQILHELTDKEKEIVFTIKSALTLINASSVLLRDFEK